jgi:hypothetical protein
MNGSQQFMPAMSGQQVITAQGSILISILCAFFAWGGESLFRNKAACQDWFFAKIYPTTIFAVVVQVERDLVIHAGLQLD